MSVTRERPLTFTGESVRSILAGTKTQTRRVVTGFEIRAGRDGLFDVYRLKGPGAGWCGAFKPGDSAGSSGALHCPYGVPGERLWVRETWALRSDVDWKAQPERAAHYALYRATYYGELEDEYHPTERWRSARLMPRVLSRLTLVVTEVRVQRLQEIGEEDAKAEGGFTSDPRAEGYCGPTPLSWDVKFATAWDEINGKRAPWASNPWCWCISFKRVT